MGTNATAGASVVVAGAGVVVEVVDLGAVVVVVVVVVVTAGTRSLALSPLRTAALVDDGANVTSDSPTTTSPERSALRRPSIQLASPSSTGSTASVTRSRVPRTSMGR